MTFEIIKGDCLEVLRGMGAESVDAVVTDPPYGLSFMGKKWDYDVPSVEIWAECLRVLKPGGHLLAFAGTRTQHRMAARIEDSGFEIRDMIAWVYGSGFPKSHNGLWGGTALKPALEPITVARKPLIGTVAENFEAHGTGGLNIDVCRVETTDTYSYPNGAGGSSFTVGGGVDGTRTDTPSMPEGGRWPANLIHDGSEEVLEAFPNAPGQIVNASTNAEMRKAQNCYGKMRRGRENEPSSDSENAGSVGFKMRPGARRLDSGSAARFFYCAKASKSERDAGLEDRDTAEVAGKGNGLARTCATCGASVLGGCACPDRTYVNPSRRNNHPTVKPVTLMRYLCRLITPPGGLVLDPFSGSGSTGVACAHEGFRFVGIELNQEYCEIARKRIEAAKNNHQLTLDA